CPGSFRSNKLNLTTTTTTIKAASEWNLFDEWANKNMTFEIASLLTNKEMSCPHTNNQRESSNSTNLFASLTSFNLEVHFIPSYTKTRFSPLSQQTASLIARLE